MSRTVAFIGMGHMVDPMAANPVKSGHRVRGYDLVVVPGPGLEPATSAADAVTDPDVVITMLPAGRHVLDL